SLQTYNRNVHNHPVSLVLLSFHHMKFFYCPIFPSFLGEEVLQYANVPFLRNPLESIQLILLYLPSREKLLQPLTTCKYYQDRQIRHESFPPSPSVSSYTIPYIT